MLALPDFEDKFHVCADASDCQLDVVTMQKGEPPAFCNGKLSETQK